MVLCTFFGLDFANQNYLRKNFIHISFEYFFLNFLVGCSLLLYVQIQTATSILSYASFVIFGISQKTSFWNDSQFSPFRRRVTLCLQFSHFLFSSHIERFSPIPRFCGYCSNNFLHTWASTTARDAIVETS